MILDKPMKVRLTKEQLKTLHLALTSERGGDYWRDFDVIEISPEQIVKPPTNIEMWKKIFHAVIGDE